jgi:hypothetical protein
MTESLAKSMQEDNIAANIYELDSKKNLKSIYIKGDQTGLDFEGKLLDAFNKK